MSIMRGTKSPPNSLCKRSASACLRTEPNTRNPFETSTFVVPQPIPVETPVTTTSLLLFPIAFLLECFMHRFGVAHGKSRPDSIHLPVCCEVVCSLPHANDLSTPMPLAGVVSFLAAQRRQSCRRGGLEGS